MQPTKPTNQRWSRVGKNMSGIHNYMCAMCQSTRTGAGLSQAENRGRGAGLGPLTDVGRAANRGPLAWSRMMLKGSSCIVQPRNRWEVRQLRSWRNIYQPRMRLWTRQGVGQLKDRRGLDQPGDIRDEKVAWLWSAVQVWLWGTGKTWLPSAGQRRRWAAGQQRRMTFLLEPLPYGGPPCWWPQGGIWHRTWCFKMLPGFRVRSNRNEIR